MKTTALPIAMRRSGGKIMATALSGLPIAADRARGLVMNAGPQNPGPRNAERMFGELTELLGTRLGEHDQQINNLAAALETMQGNANLFNAPQGVIAAAPVDAAYTAAFASYFRRGDSEADLRAANATGERAMVQNAMSAGSSTDGGYLAPVEWDRKLQQRQRATSPMRRLATVQTTAVGAYSTVWNLDTWGSGWVGETAARPMTTTASLANIDFPSGEIYAMPAATQRLLDDAAINVETWLADSVEREFNRQENIAFISGDGTNKPAGLLTYATGGTNATKHPGGAIEVVTAAITIDTLTDFLYGLGAPYRQNATWLMSSLTAAFIAKIKDADGRPIWRQSLIVGQPDTLLGRPVEIDEGMPAPTAGSLAIAFGDFATGYVINDRTGTRILRDPYTNKPFVNFYVTRRVGGGLLDPFAIRLLKVAA